MSKVTDLRIEVQQFPALGKLWYWNLVEDDVVIDGEVDSLVVVSHGFYETEAEASAGALQYVQQLLVEEAANDDA